MNSSADEKKINELLQQINNTKKPLPMKKINELKALEMMASPYNQSLINMIKEEGDLHKKKRGERKQSTRSSGRDSNKEDNN